MEILVDLAALLASALTLVAYHLFLRHRERTHPAYTIQTVTAIARTAWVESIMSEPGKEILAVQTLRNSTMAATFLASTAILLIIGVLSLSGQGDKLSDAWHALNYFGGTHRELWMVKLLLLLLSLLVAFFSFAMSIRVFNHVGYMINVPFDLNHDAISPRTVATHLNRAGRFYSVGMRAYYFVVPLLFWLFGPHLMLLATLVLVVVMHKLDRAPVA